MKTFLAIAAFLLSTPLISMDKLADEQSAEIENRIKQLEFAMNNGSFFAGREESRRSFINDQITIIEKILTANSIPHPEKKTLSWLETLKGEIAAKKKITQPAEKMAEKDETCNIVGLNKADVLRALFEAANGGGYWPAAKGTPSNDELNKILERESYDIDYLGGKPLKVNLRGNAFDTRLYNRDNGAGAAQRAIEQLRKKSSM